jgi:glycosyltransferase involved in cell wall biosynthesis
MTALEAMSCETPSIVSKFAGVSEFLSDHTDCIIADPTDKEEFASAILELLSNKRLATRIARKGLKHVRENFSWNAIAEKHIEFYERFLYK